MAYRRPTRRSNYRRRPSYRRSRQTEPTWGQVANKAWKTALYVKSLVNSELNYFEATNTVSPTDSGNLILLNGITQGDGVGARTGNQIRMKGLQMKHQMAANSTAIYSRIRMIIFIDKQPSGTAPTATQLLDTSVFPLLTAMRNRAFTRRFKVLSDKNFALVYGQDNAIKEHDMYLKINVPVVYNGSGSTVSAISSNALYCLAISNQPTNTPSVQHNFRVSYRDN